MVQFVCTFPPLFNSSSVSSSPHPNSPKTSLLFLLSALLCCFLAKRMAFLDVFSLRHLLLVSIAINLSFLYTVLYDRALKGANAPQMAHLSVPTPSSSPVAMGADDDKNRVKIPSSSSPVAMGADDDKNRVINLDHGDPTVYEKFWMAMGDKATIVITGWQSMSYFSDVGNLCWFLEPELSRQIVRLHTVVGNAITQDRHIIVGTGSTQLIQALLFALSPRDVEEPISVVAAAPYYSSYPLITNCLKSGLHKWAGDAKSFTKEGPFIELVTSPNNPDGRVCRSVVNRTGGILVHDLAYYWPQHTPISSPADHDIMLFTVSKSTGHAGTRIGWALVKDPEIVKRMVKFIEFVSIGVSKDSQLRAAKILKVAADSCECSSIKSASLFGSVYHLMAERWRQLRAAVKDSGLFSLPEFSPEFCTFFQESFESQPAFAWLKCEEPIVDCEVFLRSNKILTRGGKHFGVGPEYVRISLLDRDVVYESFIRRLSSIRLGKT